MVQLAIPTQALMAVTRLTVDSRWTAVHPRMAVHRATAGLATSATRDKTVAMKPTVEPRWTGDPQRMAVRTTADLLLASVVRTPIAAQAFAPPARSPMRESAVVPVVCHARRRVADRGAHVPRVASAHRPHAPATPIARLRSLAACRRAPDRFASGSAVRAMPIAESGSASRATASKNLDAA